MKRTLGVPRLLALYALLAVVAGCTDVTVTRSADGTEAVFAPPPVVVDKDGVHEPPTPTPESIAPVYPITPLPPTPTPRSG